MNLPVSASVLVVEDEALIAMDLQALLEEAGYRVLGPANSSAAAMALLAGQDPDVALLDVNLGRSDVFGVANELATRKTKVIFLTGHTAQKLPPAHRHRPLVAKPYLPHVLLQEVRRAIAQQDNAA
ncbi:MAG TPA: response regulator [Micropepsaceae bacterium]|jgi:CheY-like chemotaxis protein|nr:response regulator [Micropepsaceae bacterium]